MNADFYINVLKKQEPYVIEEMAKGEIANSESILKQLESTGKGNTPKARKIRDALKKGKQDASQGRGNEADKETNAIQPPPPPPTDAPTDQSPETGLVKRGPDDLTTTDEAETALTKRGTTALVKKDGDGGDDGTGKPPSGTGEDPGDTNPVPDTFKTQILQPSKNFDADKRYYLNIAGKDMKRSFNWKELKNQDIRVTFANSQNINKAKTSIQNYIKGIQSKLQGLSSPAGTGDLTTDSFVSLFNFIINEQTTVDLPPEIDIGGDIGKVPTGQIVDAIMQNTTGATSDKVKSGFDLDSILSKTYMTDAKFKQVKGQFKQFLDKYYSQLIKAKTVYIPFIGNATYDKAIKKYKLQTGTVVESKSLSTLISITKNYLNNAVSKANTRIELEKILAKNIKVFKDKVINSKVEKEIIDQINNTANEEKVIQATFLSIVDQSVQGIIKTRLDLTAAQNLHNFIYQYFCTPPNQYILYLDEDQWNDIILGGSVAGSVAGIVSGIAKAF